MGLTSSFTASFGFRPGAGGLIAAAISRRASSCRAQCCFSDGRTDALVYGTIGVIALTLGGLLGGYIISRFGLKRCLWIMVLSVHLPDLVFVYLATALPSSIYVIAGGIALEQFGYGFGFASYMLYMIMVSDGAHKTAHYAICTGFMALGMMLPGMASGWIQQMLGYQHFFIWVCIATIPACIMAALVKIDPEFGKKAEA